MRESVRKAQSAANVCKFRQQESLSYKYIGVYKFAMSILQDDVLCADIKRKIKILEDYDDLHAANLIKTLVSFVTNDGDYTSTSEECYQHANTIRYRIKKAEQLLDLEETDLKEEICNMVRCYQLLQSKGN